MLGLFYFSVLFIAGTFAQIARLGPCPSVQPVQNFQPQNITGTWYEVRRYNNLYELNHVCTRLNVTAGPGNTLTLTTRSINGLSGAVSDWSVTGTPIGNISVPQYRVNVSDQAIANNSVVTILDTDYTGFTMLYMCRQVNEIHLINLWLLSRDRRLSVRSWRRRWWDAFSNRLPIGVMRGVRQRNCPVSD
ncbi:hypothetical protein KQX54_008429 [Cotesia glomerata]|uniref:Lipocalin/cytosolic fatty-acid binding domain-containing protein n=1 Tax=Cotesia glomerata TaxID=32391 RepID=A0AAV7J7U2_COTGL|nr:hypothetical protein KQX54_008429 [Cotesia glomerata]